MQSNGFKTATVFLMASLGVACGGDSSGSATDGGKNGDGASGADGSGGDSGNTGDDGSTANDGNAGDDGGAHDGNPGNDGSSLSPQPVNLGKAAGYVILAKTAISTVPTSAVTGNLGLSPAAASFITGFPLTPDSTNVFSTTPQVTGKVYAADYAVPTPTNLTTAVSDMQTAFTDAAGRPAGVTELGAGDIGGKTLTTGVYKWGTGLLIPSDVTLNGSGTDVFIFQVAKNLTMSSGAHVHLAGGAAPANIFWQVAGSVDLGTTSHIEGSVMSMTAITLRTGASVRGRLLAQSAVSIDGSAVVAP